MWLYPDDEANMNDRKHPEFQSSAPETLEKLVMDPKVPKSEAEWWACREITRYRAGLQKIVQADGFWDAPSLARDLLDKKSVT